MTLLPSIDKFSSVIDSQEMCMQILSFVVPISISIRAIVYVGLKFIVPPSESSQYSITYYQPIEK